MIVDAHNDLLFELAFRSGEVAPFATHWLGALERGGIGLQVCAVSIEPQDIPESALRRALEQIAACHRAVRENSERVTLVRTAVDLDPVEAGDRIGLLLALEGCEPLGDDPELADVFWELGVRIFGLTWNARNAFADGLGEEPAGGLSRRGEQLVDRLVEWGAIIDLAHASEQTFADVLKRIGSGVAILSHAGCRSVTVHRRNASDAQMRTLASRGGVLGVMALPFVIDPERPTIERMIDHIDHAVNVMGVEHVGIGSDFLHQLVQSGALRPEPPGAESASLLPSGMALDASIERLKGPADYPSLVAALQERGYSGPRLEMVLHGSFMELFRRGLPNS